MTCLCFLQTLAEIQVMLMVKNPLANAGDVKVWSSIPRLRTSSGRGHGNPLQFSCLENPVDRGSWFIGSQKVRQDWSNLACMHLKFTKYTGAARSGDIPVYHSIWEYGKGSKSIEQKILNGGHLFGKGLNPKYFYFPLFLGMWEYLLSSSLPPIKKGVT